VESVDRGTRVVGTQELRGYREYRAYLTPDYWLITYRDRDLIRVMRGTKHPPGFVLLVLHLIWGLLVGYRTDLRDHWALEAQFYNDEAKILDLKAKAQVEKVIEFWWQKKRREPKVKGEE